MANGIVPIDNLPQVAQPDNLALNSARLINAALRSLGDADSAEREDSLLIDRTPAALIAAGLFEDLTPIQQNALFINETLEDLNFGTSTASTLEGSDTFFGADSFEASQTFKTFLINEIPAELAAQDIFENLDLFQENALLINETLLQLNFEAGGLGAALLNVTEPLPAGLILGELPVFGPAAEPETPAADRLLTAPPEEPAPELRRAALLEEPPVAVAAELGVAVAVPPEVTAIELEAPLVEELVLEPRGFDPASLPYLLNPSLTPYVLAAYELMQPNPLPGEPAPPDREVQPVLPIQNARHVDLPEISPAQQREENRKGPRKQTKPAVVPPVKSIQYMLQEVNEELVSRGSPLHLVLASNEAGYMLNVYNCSSPDRCVVEHDVPLELDKLPTILGSFDHEAGLIVNTLS